MKNKHKQVTIQSNAAMNTHQRRESLAKDQKGLVSIVVTLVILSVLTLITVGFATLTRREQRQSLDQQLSSEAFYAAESGVNDAIRSINDANVAGVSPNKSACTTGGFNYPTNYDIDPAAEVKVSCVTIADQPSSLIYKDVKVLNSIYTPLIPSIGLLNSVTISWNQPDPITPGPFRPAVGSPGATDFPRAGTGAGRWNSAVGALRIALTNAQGVLTHDNLVNNTFVGIFYPNAGAGAGGIAPYTLTPVNQVGPIVGGKCNGTRTPHHCSVTITGLASNLMYLRVTPLYQDATLNITAHTGSNPTNLIHAQAVVDSTGRAQDVLRRIQVRVPLNNNATLPEFAIETGQQLCKLLRSEPASVTDGCLGIPVIPPPPGSPPPATPPPPTPPPPTPPPPTTTCTTTRYVFDTSTFIVIAVGGGPDQELPLNISSNPIQPCDYKMLVESRDDTHATTDFSDPDWYQPYEQIFLEGHTNSDGTGAVTFRTNLTTEIPDTNADVCRKTIFTPITVTQVTRSIMFRHASLLPLPAAIPDGNSVHGGSLQLFKTTDPNPSLSC